MDIDLKSAGIGAGAAASLVGLIWLGKKLFTKKVVTESTPKWDQMKTMFDMFKHSTKDNTNNAKLMDEIMDSNMPASLIKAAAQKVNIVFTSDICRKEMIKTLFLNGEDGIAAIKSQYEKWKNKEFASEKKEENSESQTEETKSEESK